MLLPNLRVKARWPVAVYGIVCILLVSCARPTLPPEPVTISFAYPDWYGDHFEGLAGAFHKRYPHITVELRAVAGTVYVQSFWAGDADAFVSGTWLNNLWMMMGQNLRRLWTGHNRR